MPSIYFQASLSTDTLVKFSEKIHIAETKREVLSFSEKEIKNIGELGAAFVIYISKHDNISANCTNKIVGLIEKHIKSNFTNSEYSQCLCSAQVYLFHITSGIRPVDKSILIPGYEACLAKYINNKTLFYQNYLKDIITASGYTSLCDIHTNLTNQNQNSNRGIIGCVKKLGI